jgi:phage baseplate assembly protein V
MITFNDLNRLLAPIKRKIFLLVGRAILTAVNNSEQTQKIQVQILKDEVITDIERFQEYGFETYPKQEAEPLIDFLNGNRDHGIAICVHDRRYRPQNLTEGEVAVYNFTGNIITMKQDGEIHILYNGGSLEYAPLSSKIKDYIDNEIKTIFDAHTHPYVDTPVGASVTSPPSTTITSPALTDLSSTGVKIS